jgi:hypothetical protein
VVDLDGLGVGWTWRIHLEDYLEGYLEDYLERYLEDLLGDGYLERDT